MTLEVAGEARDSKEISFLLIPSKIKEGLRAREKVRKRENGWREAWLSAWMGQDLTRLVLRYP